MTDQPRPTPSEPIVPAEATLTDPFATAEPRGSDGAATPAAAFRGRTPRKTGAVRAGVIVGTGLLVAIGAAVAMGASPAPSSSGGSPQAVPSQGNGNHGNGNQGNGRFDPFGGFGAFGGFGPVGAGGPGKPFGGPGAVAGRGFGDIKVTAVSGSNVSLATDDGWTRTITVTGTTTITKGGAAATLSDLAVGDSVRLSQTRNADGTYTIKAIAIVLPQVAGTVTAVGTDTITIALRDGTSQTIRTNGSTAYHLEKADGKRSDVSVGSAIVASGEKAADGSLTASSVWVRLPRVAGTVTAIDGSTITLSRRDGTTLTIHAGSATTIRVAGVDNAKLSDITTGMVIAVEGTQRSDGSIDARAIAAGKLGKPGKGLGHDRQPGGAPDGSPTPNASSGTTG
jgi:preprotein translocase subunit YajC